MEAEAAKGAEAVAKAKAEVEKVCAWFDSIPSIKFLT